MGVKIGPSERCVALQRVGRVMQPSGGRPDYWIQADLSFPIRPWNVASVRVPDHSLGMQSHSGKRSLQGTADNTVAIGERFWQLEKSRFRATLAGCTVTI